MKITIAFLSILFLFITAVYATNLPIRGIARGDSKVKVGDKAPLITQELINANKEGRVIILMLGYPNHCPWCDRMERYLSTMMKDEENFGNRTAFIQAQIEHAKMIAPPDEGVRLKEAFGVEGQPWLFIIDKQGTVRFIYKVFAGISDVKENVRELLEEGKK